MTHCADYETGTSILDSSKRVLDPIKLDSNLHSTIATTYLVWVVVHLDQNLPCLELGIASCLIS